MTFLDLFAGIGGFRFGLEQAGHKCIGFCEIDKFARRSYKVIHDTRKEVELHDITTVTSDALRQMRRPDILSGGFPCQSFSYSGKRRGFRDTRGTLFFEIARFASILQPRILFLENVRGLLSHDRGDTFQEILRTLDGLGYDLEWQVLNSKDYVPQNRERVYIVGHLRESGSTQVFPFQREGEHVSGPDESSIRIQSLGNINPSGNGLSGKVYHSTGLSPTLMAGSEVKISIPTKSSNGLILAGNLEGVFEQGNRVYSEAGCAPTVTTKADALKILVKEATRKGYKEAKPGDSINCSHPNSDTRRGRVGNQIANTLLTSEEQAIVTEDYEIRKLTAKECWRLQGFPDWAYEKAAKVNSEYQLYRQAGNSVTVPVIFDIARRFKVVNVNGL